MIRGTVLEATKYTIPTLPRNLPLITQDELEEIQQTLHISVLSIIINECEKTNLSAVSKIRTTRETVQDPPFRSRARLS